MTEPFAPRRDERFFRELLCGAMMRGFGLDDEPYRICKLAVPYQADGDIMPVDACVRRSDEEGSREHLIDTQSAVPGRSPAGRRLGGAEAQGRPAHRAARRRQDDRPGARPPLPLAINL